ncbi:hypothetical protein PtB15_6B510 [Puccinia triticina]|nr:hypothetical protein PtB15_6B510 [Puccinia triticina]
MTDNPEATTSHTMINDESMDEDPAPTGCALPAVAFPSFVWTGLMPSDSLSSRFFPAPAHSSQTPHS